MSRLIGEDTDGVTQISLRALMELHVRGEVLREVRITSNDTTDTICEFEFESRKIYRASGFSIGYGGEGPHGLWTAIRTFHTDKISGDFWATPIAKMPAGEWTWIPGKGFIRNENLYT